MFSTKLTIFKIIALTAIVLMLCCGATESRTIDGNRNYHHLKKELNALPPYPVVQMCRDSCLGRFMNKISNKGKGESTKDECGHPDCFMCWDYCGMLNEEHKIIASLMCNDDICFDGCKHACKFYQGLPWKLKKANNTNSNKLSLSKNNHENLQTE